MYIIIWEFTAKVGQEEAFEHEYGPQGAWAKFFSKGEGYLRTELLHDCVTSRRYFTIDHWTSNNAYDSFHRLYSRQYEELDRQCMELTESETHVGSFTSIDTET